MKKLFLLLSIACFTFSIQAQPGTLLSAKKVGTDNNFQFFDTMTNCFVFGKSVCNLGDIDGDGNTDIAIGANCSNPSSGYVFILFMDSNGGVKSYKKIAKNENGLNTTSPNAFTEFGQSITNLGDMDGDGVVDIAVGNKGSSFGGEVYILFLNIDGTVKNHSRIASNVGGFNVSLTSNQIFSYSIANIGDIDGDGVIDIAVGDYRDDDGGAERGSVYILFLNQNGTVKKHQKISQTAGGFSGNLVNSSSFGFSICKFSEKRLFIGARGDSDGTNENGSIWLLDIDSSGQVINQKKYTKSTNGFDDSLTLYCEFGGALANIGDIDGDGISEIAVGAPGYNDNGTASGAIFIIALDSNDDIKFLKRFSNSVGNLPFTFDEFDLFGISISNIGDYNKDKKLDIIVGSSREDAPSRINKGRLNLLFLDGIEHDLSTSKLSTNSKSISVYPNPADSKIKVAINSSTLHQADVMITDVSGKICLSLQNFDLSNEIDVSLLKAGVYFIRLQTSEGIFQSKFIVQ
jgi:hypothetical protein